MKEREVAGGTWAGLQPGQRSAINAVRVRNGKPMIALGTEPADKTPAGILGTPDLRMPNVVLAERPEIPGFNRVGVSLAPGITRESPQYKAALAVFSVPPEVGGPGGAADRGMVADALFADAGGGIPELMSKDELVWERLAKHAGIKPVNGSMKNAVFPPGAAKPALTAEFTITVDVGGGVKKQLKVIAVNNQEVPP